MIPLLDIATPDRRDISAIWRMVSGDVDAIACANMRGGMISSISVRLPGQNPLVMCRAGAAAILSEDTIRSIEITSSGKVSHDCE